MVEHCPIEDSQAQGSEMARRVEPVGETGREPRGAVNSGITGNEGAESTRAVAVGNPFWSQKARDELQLQLARPDFLENATASSSSTELRAVEAGTEQLQGPVGPPVTYAPAGLRITVEVAQTEQHIPRESSVEQGTAEAGESHGLSSRERYILTQMKNAMLQISQQNEELLSQIWC